MWVLVYVKLLFPEVGFYEVDAQIYGQYGSMDKCFESRDMLLLDMGYINGYPPIESQIVCIQTENGFK
jgi:hypothetical protein